MKKLSQSEAMTFSGHLAGKWDEDTILSCLFGGCVFLTIVLYCFSVEQSPNGGQRRAERPAVG